MAQTAWRKDRITSRKDADGFRVVELPKIAGMTAAQVKEVFAFERERLGTVRATIRANKRAAGQTLTAVARLGTIPASLAFAYGESEEAE